MFPDSYTAKGYYLDKTKVNYVIQYKITPYVKDVSWINFMDISFTFKFNEATFTFEFDEHLYLWLYHNNASISFSQSYLVVETILSVIACSRSSIETLLTYFLPSLVFL